MRRWDRLDKDVLTLQEASELLQVSSNTVRKLLKEGKLPGKKVGREWRFSKEALIEWLKSGQAQKKD